MPINKQEINESITQLNNVSKQICSSELTDTNPSIKLASWLSGIPLIYYPSGLKAAAIRFKNSLQENSKTHVIVEEILESCHNGIVAWQKPSSFQPILIKGVDDHPKTKERWEILTDFFSTKNIDFREVSTVSGGILSKLISIIYFLDYTSIYKAILSGIDPTPVPEIEFIKNKL